MVASKAAKPKLISRRRIVNSERMASKITPAGMPHHRCQSSTAARKAISAHRGNSERRFFTDPSSSAVATLIGTGVSAFSGADECALSG